MTAITPLPSSSRCTTSLHTVNLLVLVEALRTRLAQPVVVDGRRVVGSALAGFVVRAVGVL